MASLQYSGLLSKFQSVRQQTLIEEQGRSRIPLPCSWPYFFLQRPHRDTGKRGQPHLTPTISSSFALQEVHNWSHEHTWHQTVTGFSSLHTAVTLRRWIKRVLAWADKQETSHMKLSQLSNPNLRAAGAVHDLLPSCWVGQGASGAGTGQPHWASR